MSTPTYPDPARPAPARTRAPRTDPPANPGRRGLALVPAGHPGRATRKPLGTPAGQPPGSAMVGLGVATPAITCTCSG